MFNQALNINKSQDNKKSNELTEEDYDLINKDISKALSDMKKDNKDQDEDNNNNEENENEDDLAYFDKDFFTDSSNSISHDNFSDISENSFKSANIGMRNNYIKNNIMNDNININQIINKEIHDNQNSNIFKRNEIIKKGLNYDNNFHNNNMNVYQNNLYKNNNNKSNSSIQTNNFINLNNINQVPHFNDNNFNNNIMQNQFFGNNNKNIINMNNNINNFQMNNNPSLFNNNMNNFPVNINLNLSNQLFNNNMINNANLIKPISNNFLNHSPFDNNIINYNNNLNNNKIFLNERKNNSFTSFPVISDRGVPGLYNLDSPKNIINLENILRNRDKRTTLIIRNIPNKYTINLLLKELNQNFENKFDIVYLPQDYINNSNLGFGFINFVNSMHLLLFYEEFVNKKWNSFNSKKRCNLAYSKYQGKNELIKYILNKLGISTLDNNSENIRKSFYINNNKNIRAPIEIPIKYYGSFVSYHPYTFCHYKNDKIFIVDKYYNI